MAFLEKYILCGKRGWKMIWLGVEENVTETHFTTKRFLCIYHTYYTTAVLYNN